MRGGGVCHIYTIGIPPFPTAEVMGINYSPKLLQESRPYKMETKEALGFPKGGRVMTSFCFFCPQVPPTATHPLPRSLPTLPCNPHPHSQLDPEKPLCSVLARNRPLGPRGSLPRPSLGPGGGEASPNGLPTSVSGVLLGKIYDPLRFGNCSHTKKKEEREKEMILIFFRSRNEAEVSKF